MTAEDESRLRESRAKAGRARTLRVLDLVQTKVQSVRIELVGGENHTFDRLATWVFYMPFLVVGYTLVLGAAISVVHSALGWAPSLFLFGVAHLIAGAWGVLRGRSIGQLTRDAVLDPRVASSGEVKMTHEDGESEAIPRIRPTVLPLPFRGTPRQNENHGLPLSESVR
jgi:hypothetical protein